MANIGDLVFTLKGDPKQLNVDVAKAGDKAGTTFGQRMSASLKKSWSGGEIGKGLVQGLGLAGGLGAAALFSTAISKIGDVLGDATQAALAEEVSIQKLSTALKANIPAWDGQTAAIEKTLKARMALGFSDDEQRESLALLVVATKDVNKALAIQRTAMDLARLKGVDLKTASEALIKVEGGQFRALKALGIQLPKNATATEALAAVTKAAKGQAEDYAKTNAGKLLASQVKVGEAMEKLGAKTMPLVTDATVAAADAVTTLADALDILDGKTDLTNQEQVGLAATLLDLAEMTPGLGVVFTEMGETVRAGLEEANAAAHSSEDTMSAMARSAAEDLGGVEGSMIEVGDTSGDMARDIKADNREVVRSWKDLTDALKADTDSLISDTFDPLITKNQLAAANAEAAAARRVIASKTASNAEKGDAHDALDSVAKDTASMLNDLADAGMTGSAAFKTGLASLEEYARTTSGETRKQLDKVIAKIKELERIAKVVPINIVVTGLGNLRDPLEGLAGGGTAQAHTPYLVGEYGPEIILPSAKATILSNAESMPYLAATGTEGGNTYQVNLLDRLEVRTPRDISDGLRMLESRGYLNLRRQGRKGRP